MSVQFNSGSPARKVFSPVPSPLSKDTSKTRSRWVSIPRDVFEQRFHNVLEKSSNPKSSDPVKPKKLPRTEDFLRLMMFESRLLEQVRLERQELRKTEKTTGQTLREGVRKVKQESQQNAILAIYSDTMGFNPLKFLQYFDKNLDVPVTKLVTSFQENLVESEGNLTSHTSVVDEEPLVPFLILPAGSFGANFC